VQIVKQFPNLLVITHESVGEKMAGPSIRYWEISRALGAQGVDVSLATPYESSRSAQGVEIKQFFWEDPHSLFQLINDHEVILANGPVTARVVHLLGEPIPKPTVVDIYYSPEIEQMMLNIMKDRAYSVLDSAAFDDLHTYLRQGDLFTCAIETQYDFWLGGMLTAGRMNTQTLRKNLTLNHMLKMVPMGFPDTAPIRGDNMIKGVVPGIAKEDKVIYWGGGVWDWTDPITLLKAFKQVLEHRDDVRLVFGALHHYEQEIVPEMSVTGRLMEFIRHEDWLDKYVFFLDWVPYDDRGTYLLEVDLGVGLTLDTIENRYAVRARFMDCLWAALPCITNEGDDIGEKLRELGLARLVQPGDVDGVRKGILEFLGNDGIREKSNELVKENWSTFSWSGVVQPLLEYLEDPVFAPDAQHARSVLRNQIPLRKEWEDLRAENIALNHQIDMVRQRRIIRFTDRVNKFLGRE
jgi:glycosyltransferase involved in cell wall biosynthesis